MKKMLIISRFCPFDAARYAGSKTHNYYLKRLRRDFDVKLISFAAPNESPLLDLAEHGIDSDVSFVDGSPRHIPLFLMYNWQNVPNYFGKTLGLINGYLKKILLVKLRVLKKLGYAPDIIILEWTQMLLMIDAVRTVFPSAFYVASEHDVTFLRLERQYGAARGIAKFKEGLRYRSLRKAEIASLNLVDLIAPHSVSDRDLLVKNGLSAGKIHPIAPFVSDYSGVKYNPLGTRILFYGAMDRSDNYRSAIWFLEHVFFPLLSPSWTFCILGGRPHRSLDKFRSERVAITGFVPDIRPYLGQSMCMVAPLVLGAGIKVKVIEAMGAGLPILANRIALEGIPALGGVHYLHCERPDDYKKAFDDIENARIDLRAISKNAREFVAATFNLDSSYASYRNAILTRFEQTVSQRKAQS